MAKTGVPLALKKVRIIFSKVFSHFVDEKNVFVFGVSGESWSKVRPPLFPRCTETFPLPTHGDSDFLLPLFDPALLVILAFKSYFLLFLLFDPVFVTFRSGVLQMWLQQQPCWRPRKSEGDSSASASFSACH